MPRLRTEGALSLVISPVCVFVTFLSGVFANVLVTSAWRSSRGSVQDPVLFKLIVSKAKVLCGKVQVIALVPWVPRAGDIQ